jgi:hypothetical protein
MQSRASCRTRFNSAFRNRQNTRVWVLFAAPVTRQAHASYQTTPDVASPRKQPWMNQDPDMYPRLRFVTRAPSTAVFPPTLNRQR